MSTAMHESPAGHEGMGGHAMPGKPDHYRRLALMAAVSFAVMYALMYAMVDSIGSVYMNVNQFYMAGLMAAPMVAIELLLMGAMYGNTKLNRLLILASIVLAAIFWFLIRQQGGVGDRQFLRSMIPHHSGAILMCGKAKITDPRIQKLCGDIIVSQRQEIEQMKALLAEGGRR